MNDSSIDPQSRAIIRYGLETDDPWLAELVRRADAGESIVDTLDCSQTPDASERISPEYETRDSTSSGHDPSEYHRSDDASIEKKIEALTELICGGCDGAGTNSAALLVLMAKIENATHPKALANSVKHLAFTRCGELNLGRMVDDQIVVLEAELLSNKRRAL